MTTHTTITTPPSATGFDELASNSDRIGAASAPRLRPGQPLATHWRARLTATRPMDAEPWLPSGDDHDRARLAGATLQLVPNGYTVHLDVTSPDLVLATRATTATWARLYEQCTLPDWPLTVITIKPAPSHSRAPRTSAPRTNPTPTR